MLARVEGPPMEESPEVRAYAVQGTRPPPPGALLDDEAGALLQRASWIGGRGRSDLVSFTSLFLAFFRGGDPLADFVRATARDLDVTIANVLDAWRSSDTFPPALTEELVLQAERAPVRDQTPSVGEVIARAASIAADTGSTAVGARHLLAVYVLGGFHHDDLRRWRVRVRPWAARLLTYVARAHPTEATAWRQRFRSELAADTSSNVREVLVIAGQQPGPTPVDEMDLLAGLLEHGRRHQGEALASAWLVARLANVPPSPGPATTEPGDGPLVPLAPGAIAWLGVAATYALSSPVPQVQLRHLVAALLSPRGPTAARARLRELGTDPDALADAFLEMMTTTPVSDDYATWRWLLANDRSGAVLGDATVIATGGLRMPGYANDQAAGTDYLQIGRDVEAMAAVIAASKTEPPLSVGLFGDWGSGKSFFMRKLRDQIAALAEASKKAGEEKKESYYCSDVAQIEFNAWHYMDADLWASLVSHVLDRLERHFRRDEKPPLDLKKEELAAVELDAAARAGEEKAQRDAAAATDQELARLADKRMRNEIGAGTVLREAKREIARYVAQDPTVRAEVERVEKELGRVAGTLGVEDVKQLDGAWRRAWMRAGAGWRERPSVGKAVLVVVFLLPIAAWVAASAREVVPAVGAAAITVITPLVGLATMVMKGWNAARPALAAISAAVKRADKVEADLRSATAGEVELLKQRDTRIAEAERLAAERAELEKQAAALRAEIDQLAKQSTLRDYVLRRAASDEYRKRLGVVASVHRDFQNLSDRLADPKASGPTLQRIVLYIDDLDRCPPDRVVEVLQAIHLILSFRLFVVVVAVDSGWLLQSLDAYYAKQFGNNGAAKTTIEWAARPQHYLEKIFQIPYTLRSMSTTGFGDLVDGLLGEHVREAGAGNGAAARARVAAGANGTAAADTVAAADAAATAAATAAPAATAAAAATAAPAADSAAGAAKALAKPAIPVIDVTPRSLEITRAELDHLSDLGALVPTPRAAKRLVNLYRIVRAGIAADKLDEFVAGRYQLTQICLAAVIGCPDVAADVFKQILTGDLADAAAVSTYLLDAKRSDRRYVELDGCAKKVLAARAWKDVQAECFAASRYAFETGRVLRDVRELQA